MLRKLARALMARLGGLHGLVALYPCVLAVDSRLAPGATARRDPTPVQCGPAR